MQNYHDFKAVMPPRFNELIIPVFSIIDLLFVSLVE